MMAIDVYKLHWPEMLPRLPEFSGFLSADERERAARFYFEKDRRRFTLCRGWLRCILAGRLDMQPGAVVFSQGAHGKPAVDGPWQFNLSHSGEWAVCAVARDLPVGVDIEAHRDMPDAADLADRFFTPDEARLIRAGAPGEPRFFTVWTRKEAFVKAAGTGLYTDLRSFTAGLDEEFIADAGGRRWGVRSPPIIPDHSTALCAPGEWKWREVQPSHQFNCEIGRKC
jgi:4'-phosphopantetheinyl transferase